MIEKTLIILKPDCLEKKLAGVVLNRFQEANLDIIDSKMMVASDEILASHYSHIADKPFYPNLKAFMQRRSVMVLILEGENAVATVRELLGPTDSTKAPKGTIRGDFGLNTTENIVHASDCVENAQIEIERFFA
ncbi:MAG: nucleoside-diphosphate kinase [Opitutales bacterium]